MELFGGIACVLSWKLYRSGDGMLSQVYASGNEINFSGRIEGNQVFVVKIEEEWKLNFAKV